MSCVLTSRILAFLTVAFSMTGMAEVPPDERAIIDRIIGAKGAYTADEGVYKIVLPREGGTIGKDLQKLSPNLELNSWVTFSPAVHQEAMLAGEFMLLDDEVNPVLSAALDAGLEVSALANSSVFHGSHLHTLNVSGTVNTRAFQVRFGKVLARSVVFAGTRHLPVPTGRVPLFRLKTPSMADHLTRHSR